MNYRLYDERKILIDKTILNKIINEFHNNATNKSGIIKINHQPIHYNFIAKGGQGQVFSLEYDNHIFAIKQSKIINKNEKQLLELMGGYVDSHICPHFLLIYAISTIENKDYVLMEKIDGDLNNWLSDEHTDDEWMSFLFQMLISVYVMKNYAKTYHNDMKPKNILFKILQSQPQNAYLEYKLGDNTYYVPVFDKLFIIGDFGQAQSLLLNSNKMNNDEIKQHLDNNDDFINIHTLPSRIKVDNIIKNCNINDIINLFKKNQIDYEEYYNKSKNEINRDMKSYPQHIKDNMLLKSMAYFLIENKLYEQIYIKNKSKMILPSIKIQKFIEDNFNGKTNPEDIINKHYQQYISKPSDDIIEKYTLV